MALISFPPRRPQRIVQVRTTWLNTSTTCNNATPSSRNAWSSCGAIFDATRPAKQIAEIEEKTSAPDFWDNQEKAQAVLQERKQLEDRVNAEKSLAGKASDIETYFHLAQEESDHAQREAILDDVAKEMAAADALASGLETKTLLGRDNDALNAILTVKPGAGGIESQDWAEMLLRMYLRWAEDKGFQRERPRFDAGGRGGHQVGHGAD